MEDTKEKEDDLDLKFKVFKAAEVHNTYSVYLGESFEAPSEYWKIFQALDTATDKDTFVFHLASYGGRVDAGIAFATHLAKTKAHTKTLVEAPCYSMGAVFPFLTKEVEMSPSTFLMFHDFSTGFGRQKGNEIKLHVDVFSRLFKDLLKTYCSKILSDDEIEGICKGCDIYLTEKDIKKRLSK